MTVLEVLQLLFIAYALTYAIGTMLLLVISLRQTFWYSRGALLGQPPELARTPSVSLVVPAHNEETLIVQSTSAFLDVDYPKLEVVIVDDGSEDETLTRLVEAFELVPLPPLGGQQPLETAPIEQIYVSRSRPALRVVRKQNGGRSDAINAGMCIARGELIAITDADGLLEPDAITRAVKPFEVYPDDCVGVGGEVRIANGSTIEGGRVRARVATSGLAATQMLEYLRGFYGARIAWASLNGLVIISGAFGIFRRDMLIALGGMSKATLGEDMEITMRLHHELRPQWKDARVAYAPDAICWTEAPAQLRSLKTQRVRWHVGLIDNLRLHQAMIGRRRFGVAGTAALPFAVLYEAIAPIFEVAGYTVGILLVIFRPSDWPYLAIFLLVDLLLAQVLNVAALLIAEIGFHRYTAKDMLKLAFWGLIESLWYRPLTAWWRTLATFNVLIGRRPGWGSIPRGATLERPADAVAPLTR